MCWGVEKGIRNTLEATCATPEKSTGWEKQEQTNAHMGIAESHTSGRPTAGPQDVMLLRRRFPVQGLESATSQRGVGGLGKLILFSAVSYFIPFRNGVASVLSLDQTEGLVS